MAAGITVKESAHSWGMDGEDELHPFHMSVSHEKPTMYTTACTEKHYTKQKRKAKILFIIWCNFYKISRVGKSSQLLMLV